MASRNILHRSKLESFKEYLISKGWVIQDTKGLYEVLRAVNPEVMKRPLIIYDGKSKEHLSVDDRDFEIVRDFINHRGTDIKLVIKLPEEEYKHIMEMQFCIPGIRDGKGLLNRVLHAIRTGTSLPKGHGDLVDTNELIENGVATESYLNTFIKTIIKADKEEV